jgi:hypothetical protein
MAVVGGIAAEQRENWLDPLPLGNDEASSNSDLSMFDSAKLQRAIVAGANSSHDQKKARFVTCRSTIARQLPCKCCPIIWPC